MHDIDHCIPLLIANMLAPNLNHCHMRLLSKYCWQCPRIYVGFHQSGCWLFFRDMNDMNRKNELVSIVLKWQIQTARDLHV
jgi:hypothetical protein